MLEMIVRNKKKYQVQLHRKGKKKKKKKLVADEEIVYIFHLAVPTGLCTAVCRFVIVAKGLLFFLCAMANKIICTMNGSGFSLQSALGRLVSGMGGGLVGSL